VLHSAVVFSYANCGGNRDAGRVDVENDRPGIDYTCNANRSSVCILLEINFGGLGQLILCTLELHTSQLLRVNQRSTIHQFAASFSTKKSGGIKWKLTIIRCTKK
jgi:hypothetical protein